MRGFIARIRPSPLLVRPTCLAVFAACAVLAGFDPLSASARAQCDLVFKESFRLGERPHGGNGRARFAGIHDSLNDFWPQIPNDGTMWNSGDNGGSHWMFAATSTDPAEFDPLDVSNGTLWSDGPATATAPLDLPAGVIRASADVVHFGLPTTTAYFGFSSSPTFAPNLAANGALWLSFKGSGEWTLYANGTQVLASGVAPMSGLMDSGWHHFEFTYDPATATVTGRVAEMVIPPTAVTVTLPLSYLCVESPTGAANFNNVIVAAGELLEASAPAEVVACEGEQVVLHATTNAAEPAARHWRNRYGNLMVDGVRPSGAVFTGTDTDTLTIDNFTAAEADEYSFIVANECGVAATAQVVVSLCDAGIPGDMNCDGVISVGDIGGFVLALTNPGGYAASFPNCDIQLGDIDGNGQVSVSDIGAFVALLAG